MMGILAVSACLFSCANDGEDIGSPLEIYKDYDLPQSGASDAANQRILNYYDKYDSFVLYDFTNKDAMWVMSTGNASSGGREYITTLGDPANVDAMLDYIEDIWLKYFSEDFLKKGGMLYRVFLADSLYMQRDFGDGNIMKTPTNYMINGDALIIAGMNVISELTDAEKKARKLELINALWNYYKGKGLVDNPEEFYAGTDYITPPHMSYEIGDYGYGGCIQMRIWKRFVTVVSFRIIILTDTASTVRFLCSIRRRPLLGRIQMKRLSKPMITSII